MIALQTDPPHGSTSSSPLCLEVTPTAPISILFRQRYLHSRAYLTQRTRASKQEYLVFPAAKGVSSCSGLWFCISHLVKMFPTVPLTFPTRVHPPLPISQSFNGFIIFEWGFDPVHANICCGFLLVVKVGIVNLFTGVGWMFLLSKRQLDTYLLGKLASVPSHDCGSRRHEQTNLRHILLFLLCTLNNTSFFFRLIYIILNFRVMQPYVITC